MFKLLTLVPADNGSRHLLIFPFEIQRRLSQYPGAIVSLCVEQLQTWMNPVTCYNVSLSEHHDDPGRSVGALVLLTDSIFDVADYAWIGMSLQA